MNGKEIKNVFPYFNKIITKTQEQNSVMEVKSVKGQLIFTLFESASLAISYTVKNDGEDFEGLLFNYRDVYNGFSKIKAKDEVSVSSDTHRLTITVNDEIRYVVSNSKSTMTGSKVNIVCKTTDYDLLKCIEESKVFSNRGSMDYNNNLFFNVKNNYLNIYNTNDVAMVFNKIRVEENHYNEAFAILNENISTLYKWINAIKNLEITIALCDNFVFFKTENEVLKLMLVKPHNFDAIIRNFENVDNLDLVMRTEDKVSSVKSEIYAEANKLAKDNNLLILSDNFTTANDSNIKVDKKLFLNIINYVSDDSNIGVIENPLKPILISNEEEGISHKLIFNTIH